MYDDKKMITEATTSNVWIIKNKKLFTPPPLKKYFTRCNKENSFSNST